VRAAALLLGHNLLARGRDLGADETTRLADPNRDLTIASLDWASAASVSPPIAVVWLHPAKDPDQRRPRYPMVVQRRSSDGPFGSDPLCTYDALRAA
jgi:hypothetical protein